MTGKTESLERSERKAREGVVLSAKMQKTVVVGVSRTYRHPLFEKVVKKTSRFYAHDLLGAKEGDRVLIVESRPLSKLKRWRVAEILERAK
jgi:small subunit ribosomal protein S17